LGPGALLGPSALFGSWCTFWVWMNFLVSGALFGLCALFVSGLFN